MELRMRRLVPLAAAAAIACSVPALAQTNEFVPPKLVKQGTSQSAISGAGQVEVQVLVKADGTFAVQKVVKSTNPADNKAALEIVNSSKYKPATNGGKPTAAFYTFKLSFSGAGAATTSDNSGTGQYLAMIRAGNFGGAKEGLTSYVSAHGGDQNAYALLGVADAYAKDYPGAAAAFDKAGTIPANYKSVALDAYARASDAALSANDSAGAIANAQKAIALSPDAAGYLRLGEGQLLAQQFAPAAQSLAKSRDLAASEKLDDKARGIISGYLTLAYFRAGQLDDGTTAMQDTLKLDPGNKTVVNAAFNAYAGSAQQQAQSGNTAAAAGMLEKAAGSIPQLAGQFYTRAAGLILAGTGKADNARALADANKAIAADPSSAEANYYAGVASANMQQYKDATAFMQKAQSLAQASNNNELATRAAGALKQLGSTPPPTQHDNDSYGH